MSEYAEIVSAVGIIGSTILLYKFQNDLSRNSLSEKLDFGEHLSKEE